MYSGSSFRIHRFVNESRECQHRHSMKNMKIIEYTKTCTEFYPVTGQKSSLQCASKVFGPLQFPDTC